MVVTAIIVDASNGGGLHRQCRWWGQSHCHHLGGGCGHVIDTGVEVACINNIGGGCILQMMGVIDVGGSHILQVEAPHIINNDNDIGGASEKSHIALYSPMLVFIAIDCYMCS